MERLAYEERHDWASGAWATRYDITQTYDKNGNRATYHRNVVAGYTADYGDPRNLAYAYDALNAMTAVTDADDANYACVVTCDANNNITEIEEQRLSGGVVVSRMYNQFFFDDLNRLTEHRTRSYSAAQSDWQRTQRTNYYDAVGRLVKSGYRKYWETGIGNYAYVKHTYAGSRHTQNVSTAGTYGSLWRWAGAQHEHQAPLKSPNADTTAQSGYNLGQAGGAGTPQRRTFVNPTTEGNQRHLHGQGKPMSKDGTGGGANWSVTTLSNDSYPVGSRFFYEGTVTATDMSRATDAREKGRIGIFGTSLSYAGSSGRATSEPIGRDINPLGRGDGMAYVGGAMNLGELSPALPLSNGKFGTGNSINNSGQCGGGSGCANNPPSEDGGTLPTAGLNPLPGTDPGSDTLPQTTTPPSSGGGTGGSSGGSSGSGSQGGSDAIQPLKPTSQQSKCPPWLWLKCMGAHGIRSSACWAVFIGELILLTAAFIVIFAAWLKLEDVWLKIMQAAWGACRRIFDTFKMLCCYMTTFLTWLINALALFAGFLHAFNFISRWWHAAKNSRDNCLYSSCITAQACLKGCTNLGCGIPSSGDAFQISVPDINQMLKGGLYAGIISAVNLACRGRHSKDAAESIVKVIGGILGGGGL